MRDDFNRINADAHNITDLLNHNFFAAVNRFDDSMLRWYLQEVSRFHISIGEALGRIEKQLHNTRDAGTSNIREGSIREENDNSEGSIPVEENSSSSKRDELLRRQQSDNSAQTSSNFDGGSSREEVGTERQEEKSIVTSDPDYIL